MPQLQLENQPHYRDIEVLRAGLRQFNIRQAPEILQLPNDNLSVVARDAHGQVIGGVFAEMDWGWCFIDTVWVHPDHRKKGLATRLMFALEQEVVRRGLQNFCLVTTSFQALPLYLKLGYTVYGELDNRPNRYTYYYLQKQNVTSRADTEHFELQVPPNSDDLHTLDSGLRADIALHRPLDMQELAVFIRENSSISGDSNILGGIIGATYWDWFDLRLLWVEERWRGKGYGERLLQVAEEECLRRGILNIVCDTADFQALPFYQKHGFRIFGTLDNRPPGHTSYYLRKGLA